MGDTTSSVLLIAAVTELVVLDHVTMDNCFYRVCTCGYLDADGEHCKFQLASSHGISEQSAINIGLRHLSTQSQLRL